MCFQYNSTGPQVSKVIQSPYMFVSMDAQLDTVTICLCVAASSGCARKIHFFTSLDKFKKMMEKAQ
jgi:hypothetical protein